MEDKGELDAGIIYAAYGELMHMLVYIELGLWQIRALGLRSKKGMSDAQAFDQVEKWDGTTFGALYRGIKTQPHWPEDLIWKVGQAVELRNHLAHNFLREFFLAAESQANFQAGVDQLLMWHELVEDLSMELDKHIKSLGGVMWDDLDVETKAMASSLQPEHWPLRKNELDAD